MTERIRNVIKRDSKKTKLPPASDPDTELPTKRRKCSNQLLRRYPVENQEIPLDNTESLEQHKKMNCLNLDLGIPFYFLS